MACRRGRGAAWTRGVAGDSIFIYLTNIFDKIRKVCILRP